LSTIGKPLRHQMADFFMAKPTFKRLNIPSLYERIYNLVRQIPPGKVATYGQVARIVGCCSARQVGYALAVLPAGTEVPWLRVINYKGEISRRRRGDGSQRQRRLLETEGILFDARGRVDLRKVGWEEKNWKGGIIAGKHRI